MSSLSQAHLQRIYRPFVIGFIGLGALMLGGTMYVAWSRTVITVTPERLAVDEMFSVTVADRASDQTTLRGTVDATSMTETVIARPEGEGDPVPAQAKGQVTLHNETGSPQPLAAGTRLRADNGVIARTTGRVDVPARGTVTADVIADPLGAEGEVPPGRWVIVALWPGLQQSIYGVSDTALAGGLVRQAGALSLEELTAASNEAERKIRQRFGESQPGTMKILSPADVGTEPSVTTPSDEYRVTVTMKALTITYDANDLDAAIRQQLTRGLADGQSLVSIGTPEVKLTNQLSETEVTVQVKATGQAAVTIDSAIVQPKNFIGLDRESIATKLLGYGGIKDVDVRFSPAWRRRAPDTAERISVVLNEPQS